MSETKAVQRFKRKITVENLWMYIIKILAAGKPLKAYEVKKKLEELDIKPATITVYIVLYKMTREGLLETVSLGGETLYRPTEKGLKALSEAKNILEWARRILG